jgi:Uma2 family endonuclease
MTSQLQPTLQSTIIYPESDGKPMSDNTKQFRWIVVIQQNLDWLLTDAFVAGDLLWYPVEGDNKTCQAPDVMVAVGRPKGDRSSYKQWEEGNIVPQVVFEILSPSNTQTEMNKKLVFYDRHGVEEYYLYDPDKNDLSGWLRQDQRLSVIDPINQWISPRLQIRFDLSGSEMQIYRPDGSLFLSYAEIARRVEAAEQQLKQERQRAARLADRLRSLGIDPEQV